jgi:multidrug resistance efflux pump
MEQIGMGMSIIAILYLVLIWLIFFKFRLVRWHWLSAMLATPLGLMILATVMALFNYLTPSGRFVIVSTVTQIIPNVSGQVVAMAVKPNESVKRGDALFQIDPTPFQYKVNQLEASLAQAKQHTKQLKMSYQQSTANVAGLSAQYAYYKQRLADILQASKEGALSEFRAQDTQNQYEIINYQLQAAEAAQQNAKLAMESEIGGVNTTVAQIDAQLADAKWELDQTTIRAPADGAISIMSLSVGDRALRASPVMSIIENDIVIVGMFSPNGFRTIKRGAPVKLVFDNVPGRVYDATVAGIPRGIGQGEIAASRTFAQVSTTGGVDVYPAAISVPTDLDREQLRLGMPGKATVFSEGAGIIGLIRLILVWGSAYTAYI